MNMNLFKKITAFTVAVMMTVSAMSFTAFAEETTESSSDNEITEEVESAIQEYSVFEAIRIRRNLLGAADVYTKADYIEVSTFLVNNSMSSIRKFNLSYDFEGADASSYEDLDDFTPTIVVYKSHIKLPPAILLKDGYVHTGWLFNGQVYRGNEYFKMPACDVVLTPAWTKRPKISYVAGDYDDIVGNSTFYVISSEGAQFFLAQSDRFSRRGYVISGWKCLEDGTEYAVNEAITIGTDDLTFEAIWKPATYNVNISANNGKLSDKITTTATYTEDFILPECEFVNEGKTFAGWSYNKTIYQPGESFPVPALLTGSKIVIVATWK